MKTYHWDKDKANILITRLNKHMKDRYHYTVETLHHAFHDNFDDELENYGKSMVEIRGTETISGNPHTVDFYESDFDVEEHE